MDNCILFNVTVCRKSPIISIITDITYTKLLIISLGKIVKI